MFISEQTILKTKMGRIRRIIYDIGDAVGTALNVVTCGLIGSRTHRVRV